LRELKRHLYLDWRDVDYDIYSTASMPKVCHAVIELRNPG
jgi:hypothetical protein